MVDIFFSSIKCVILSTQKPTLEDLYWKDISKFFYLTTWATTLCKTIVGERERGLAGSSLKMSPESAWDIDRPQKGGRVSSATGTWSCQNWRRYRVLKAMPGTSQKSWGYKMSVPTTDCYTKAASVTSRHQPGAMDEKADLHQRLGVTLATGYW